MLNAFLVVPPDISDTKELQQYLIQTTDIINDLVEKNSTLETKIKRLESSKGVTNDTATIF